MEGEIPESLGTVSCKIKKKNLKHMEIQIAQSHNDLHNRKN